MYLQTLGKFFASSPNKWCLDFFFDQSNIEVIKSIQFYSTEENLTHKCHRPWCVPQSCFFLF